MLYADAALSHGRGRMRAETSRSQRGDGQKRVVENSLVKAAIGTEIRSQVGNWNEQASTQRRAWSDYGSSLKTKLNPDHKKIRAEFSAQKEKMVSACSRRDGRAARQGAARGVAWHALQR